MNIAEMRTLVRRDLRDDDPAAQRWTDDELDRHVQHAVHDLARPPPTSPSPPSPPSPAAVRWR
ncbi:MAG: hypothetical protein OXT51_09845 [Chloroflexota bacterium]|nr:hypothetical protein [Chloroflexota bacterium]